MTWRLVMMAEVSFVGELLFIITSYWKRLRKLQYFFITVYSSVMSFLKWPRGKLNSLCAFILWNTVHQKDGPFLRGYHE